MKELVNIGRGKREDYFKRTTTKDNGHQRASKCAGGKIIVLSIYDIIIVISFDSEYSVVYFLFF